jgi:hypothetical protein
LRDGNGVVTTDESGRPAQAGVLPVESRAQSRVSVRWWIGVD